MFYMNVFSSDLYDDRSQSGCSTPCHIMYFSSNSNKWDQQYYDLVQVILNFDSTVKVEMSKAIDK